MPSDIIPVRRALISVSDKTGIVELANSLSRRGIEILSTGGTAAAIHAAGTPVREVSDLTGFPEILGGRVKTLHPRVHGGLLARRDDSEHRQTLHEHGIPPIDLLLIDLYPFESVVAAGGDRDQCVETIDIGGPAMIRSAAKNHRFVCVVTDREDYPRLLDQLESTGGGTSLEFRTDLAGIALSRTAAYDTSIANWIAKEAGVTEPRRLLIAGEFERLLRYGENPHQRAAFYRDLSGLPGSGTIHLIQGKPLSYNNILDLDAGLALIGEFRPETDGPTCAIIKHGNPCGVACGPTIQDAYRRALACDRTSAFGGIVVFNAELTGDAAWEITGIFTEVVVAPTVEPEARGCLSGKPNLRLLEVNAVPTDVRETLHVRQVAGGFLRQGSDNGGRPLDAGDLTIVTRRKPSEDETRTMLFAWKVVKHATSNAIVFCRGCSTVGIGAGQVSRVDSTRIAAWKADNVAEPTFPGGSNPGVTAASDAFLPFADSIEEMARAGVTALVQPGGSIRDNDIIRAADSAGIAMAFTGIRQFRH